MSELAFIATSAPPPTSLAYWKDASFVFGYMLFLYISLGMSVRAESKSDKEKKKSSEEGKSAQRADTGGSLDSATSSGVATRAEALCQDALTTYINSLFYGAFDAKCGVGSGASGPSKSVASVAPAPIQDHRAPPPQPQVHHARTVSSFWNLHVVVGIPVQISTLPVPFGTFMVRFGLGFDPQQPSIVVIRAQPIVVAPKDHQLTAAKKGRAFTQHCVLAHTQKE